MLQINFLLIWVAKLKGAEILLRLILMHREKIAVVSVIYKIFIAKHKKKKEEVQLEVLDTKDAL